MNKTPDNNHDNPTPAGPGRPADDSRSVIENAATSDYKYGFVSDIDTDRLPDGLSEDIVREISRRKGEPEWLLDFRLEAYRHWCTLEMPRWAHLDIPPSTSRPSATMPSPAARKAPRASTR